MRPKLIPINDLTRWDTADLADVTECMTAVAKSGYFMRGPHTSELEQQLGTMLNGMNVVCVGNGTDALVLSLLSLGIKEGDKVATVANAGGYATGAILSIRAIPVLVDVDLMTAQMSAASLSTQLETHPEISAIIATHLYGLMADMQLIRELAAAKGILLIEDCAQAAGASQSGVPAGAWGDAATFSFYPTKNLACLGDGGAVAFKNVNNAEICRSLAQYGWSERYTVALDGGFNSRLDEIQAAIIGSRIKRLSYNNLVRRRIVGRYIEALNPTRYIISQDSESFVGHLAVMVTSHQLSDAQKLDQAMVGNGVHYPVLDHHQPVWRKHFTDVTLPVSEKLVKSVITLPCFPLMNDDEISRVCEVLSTL